LDVAAIAASKPVPDTKWQSRDPLASPAKLPNQIYGGGYDHHPRRDDETLLDSVHDYAQPNRNKLDPVLG
jgi:hypothetical protein